MMLEMLGTKVAKGIIESAFNSRSQNFPGVGTSASSDSREPTLNVNNQGEAATHLLLRLPSISHSFERASQDGSRSYNDIVSRMENPSCRIFLLI